MNVLEYTKRGADGIFGDFTFDGESTPFMKTLTHAYLQEDGNYIPIVKPGIYTCQRGQHYLDNPRDPSNPIPIVTFEILNVPGHSGILMPHWGNFNRDSAGCTLCGKEIITYDQLGDEMLTQSKVTFGLFMARMEGIDSFPLQVVDNS